MKTRILAIFFGLMLVGCMRPQDASNNPNGDYATKIPAPAFQIFKQISDPNRPTRPFLGQYDGPIIDAHVHLDPPASGYYAKQYLENVLDEIKAAGVETAIFMPMPNEGRTVAKAQGENEKIDLLNLDRKRIKLLCGANYIIHWLDEANKNGYSETAFKNILKKLNSDLDSGVYSGVGELAFHHFEKFTGQRVISFPPNFEPFLRILDVIGQRSAWLDLHVEPITREGTSYEDEVFGGIELFFRRCPNLKLIYSHTAMTNARNVEAILKSYPRVVMNIKLVRNHDNWRNLEPVVNSEGEFYEDWAALFERMPERFLVGSDAKFARHGSVEAVYGKQIIQFRKALGSLSPKTARMIAYENALQIF
ncbi:MAG: amidohydrolase family protein [Deltaproteobacteria bacterium]|nr:amidohydrolase family protein [Deltaproteobacteria bacterium]